MIEFRINKVGGLELVQQDFSPTVYLDHWALRYFSEDSELANRLSVALESRNGTLALSWLNLAEFTKVTDEVQTRKAETFIEAILPRIFFLEIDPFAVIKCENELLAGGLPISPPHGDLDLLRVFSSFKPRSVNQFTARDLFNVVQRSEFAEDFCHLANTVVRHVNVLRDKIEAEVKYRASRKRLPSSWQVQRGTRLILNELINNLSADKLTKITNNHAIDFLHAVVPVAYCDLVLLDKYWETQIDRMRSRFSKAGLALPIARVFSRKAKGNGIERFFNQLDSESIQ
jgi:hypothetical protein